MTSLQLLAQLRRANVRLWLDGDRLRYDAPKGALTLNLREAVSEHRAALIELLRANAQGEPSLVPVPPGTPPELSFGQRRLWFIHQLQPESTAYNVPFTVRLEGAMDEEALYSALTALVERHQTLRTTFPSDGGEARAVVSEDPSPDWQLISLEQLPAAERFAEAERQAREDAVLPFQLDQGPLLRAKLFRLAFDDHVLHACMHHIVSDGWSGAVFFRELSALYRAALEGRPAPLPPLPVQYTDFAAWQREFLEHRGLTEGLAFWLDYLTDLPTLALPTDYPRPPMQSHAGAFEWLDIPDDLFEQLRALSKREEATLFQVLLSTFFVLLGRICHQEDVVVGVPIAGRGRSEIENLIGFFVNNLVLRGDLSGTPTFSELLARVRPAVLATYAHQDVPFEMLVDELHPERDLGRNPLFQILFNHYNLSEVAAEFPPLELSIVEMTLDVSKFDLSLHCFQTGDRLVGKIEYRTDLFTAETARRLGAQYLQLLRSVVADPELPIAELDAMDEQERRRVLALSGAGEAPQPDPPSVLAMFDAQVRARPDADALIFEDERLSYAELNARANGVAAALRAQDVGPEVRVALDFERSAEMIVALLGVLKAGGAYVPLDPTHPERRREQVVADSAAAAILNAASLAGFEPLESFDDSDVDPTQAAYALYTSGSTGLPKGVEIEHGQLASYVRGVLDRLDPPPGISFATVSTLAADLGNTSIFGALCSGGALHVLSEERIGDADAFAAYMQRESVDCVKIVPSHLEALLAAAARPAEVLPRRLLVMGGEACSWRLLERVRELAPELRIVNHYGPTEATVGVLTHELSEGDRERFPAGLPIGRPLPGVSAHVRGPAGELLPIGAVGELFVGGATVARGYLGRPDLTAERFVPDPFSPGGRLYATGDLVRRASAGSILFLGRADDQIKVRGFRVEPGEIEAVLARQPGIGTSAVVARAGEDGRGQIVAYVVGPCDLGELRASLQGELPAYMVPSSFIRLDALPLTPNGKLDLRALPEADVEGVSRGEYVAPRTPAEETLAAIWAQVLRVERVGIHDDYFHLGGESILSIQIVSRANQAGLRLSPRDLFECPTVESLARRSRAVGAATAETGPATGPVPLTPILRRFLELEPVDPHHYNHALLLELRRPLADEVLEQAAAALVEHHDALRLRLRRTEGDWAQRIEETQEPSVYCSENLDGRDLAARAGELQASLDLERGPILSLARLRPADGRDRLLFLVHHLAVDAVSWGVLLEDLETACEQLEAGRPVSLPAKTAPFRRFAERLVEYARSPELSEEAQVWSRLLRGAGAQLPLEGISELSARDVAVCSTELDDAETETLLRIVPRSFRASLEDALLAALSRTLLPWVGASTLAVEREAHGRELLSDELDLSRTVGWFTAVHPVVLSTEEGEDALVTLKRVQASLREIPADGSGWGILRYLTDAENVRDVPTAQVGFNYLGRIDAWFPEEALFAPAAEPAGSAVSPRNRRRYPLELTAAVRGGRLHLDWVYDGVALAASTVERLAEHFLAELRELVVRAAAGERPPLTPSDFPLAQVGADQLAAILERYAALGVEDIYAATPLQQGMLFHTLAVPDSSAYVTQIAFTLKGTLDPAAFQAAWQSALGRHPVLRSAMIHMQQVVCRAVELPWYAEDLRGLSSTELEATIAKVADADRERGFDLAVPPLLRLSLLRTGDDSHRFVWTHHHVLLDGWSLPLLIGEVFRHYAGAGEPSPARPFADFARWLAEQDQDEAEDYWRGQLADWHEPTPLPGGAARAPGRASSSMRRSIAVSEALTAELQEFVRNRGLTLNTLVQGAWALLLARFAGEREVVFGVTVSGRPPEMAGIEGMIGLFLNTLPLRIDTADAELVGWLKGVQAQQLELQRFQYSPLFEIQGLSGGGAGVPLFESILVYENYPTTELEEGPGAALEIQDAQDASFAEYPLALVVRPASMLHLELRFDASRMEPELTERLLAHLHILLGSMVSRPAARLSELSLLEPHDAHRQVITWNETRAEYPANSLVHVLFEEVAQGSPDAVALEFEGATETYGALARRGRRLARFLRARGVERGDRVALCLERGPDFVASILGVLECGAAYVPIDPDHPAQRNELILQDSQPAVLLLHESLREKQPAFDGLVVSLDSERAAIEAEDDAALPTAGDADAVAYVMYTSGSTGRPKGVCVPHRAIVRLVRGADYVQVRPEDGVAQLANVAFDAATFEIWGALLNGARVVVLPAAVALSPPLLAEEIRARAVSVLFVTTALFNQLARGAPGLFAPLRVLLFGGEAVDPAVVRGVLADGPPERLLHVYGPTENTTFSTWHEVTEVPPDAVTVPIGRPIANTTAYVLDRAGNPAPLGAPGELVLGGDGLADGYLASPEATAAAFVPHPIHEGERVYRTGDLVRQNTDGAIEFLGRVDHQIKLRGFRIELGEIEAALVRLPAVRDAAVLLRGETSEDKQLVAYVVPHGAERPSGSELRAELALSLPQYMVPAAFVDLDELPLTPNGKLDRRALPAPELGRDRTDGAVAPRGEIEQRVAAIWGDVLGLEQIGIRDNFFDLGGHSLRLLQVHQRLVEELGAELKVTDLFELPTVETLAARLTSDAAGVPGQGRELPAVAARRPAAGATGECSRSIAVIAMAGRFPGARDVESLWSNLRAGVESIRFFEDDELRAAGLPEELLNHPRYVKAKAVLDGIEYFDAGFFGTSPREAELLDPQQRVFLECAWEALERAGYDAQRYSGAIAVYAGVSTSTYIEHLRSHPKLFRSISGMQGLLVSDKDFVATRVSYQLGLRGPSMTVQTACSTGLVAVHLACRALLDGQCDMAMAGGVSIALPMVGGYMYEPGGIRSSDGHNRTFDAQAAGTVSGQGAAVVVLKRLDEALADGDHVHAVIRGTALNNDGSQKVGYTAPSALGQAEVIAAALADAELKPEDISYVEAHGTATTLGDPIEVAALTKVFRRSTKARGFCGLGSIKSNMGHLNEAAGVAGLIKTALALEHRELPPSLHYESPNPQIDFDDSPFYVVRELTDWTSPEGVPRRAGASSFGLGGTNAHVILEEPPPREPSGPGRALQILPLSAKSPEALDQASANLAAHLRAQPELNLSDVAFTLQVGRRQFAHRRAIIARDTADALEALEGGAPERALTWRAPEGERPLVFLFPGHGHQHVDMGRGLYGAESAFREVVDECLELLRGELDLDLRAAIFVDRDRENAAAALLGRPALFQPAVFVIEYALARLLASWGLEPSACIGHSLGEFAAACVAGVFELPDALRVVCLRGRLMEATPPGSMLAVPLAEAELRGRLAAREGVWISTINAPELCLVSGEPERVAAFERELEGGGIECSRLEATHAYHSPLMNSGVAPLVEAVRGMALSAPSIPFLSNVTGDWIRAEEATDPEYWGRHLREPVRFSDGMGRLLEREESALLEVGPGQIASSLARMHPACAPGRPVIAAMRHPKAEEVDDNEFLAGALGRLWTAGVAVDWERSHEGEGRRRLVLPTYPFQRQRFWIELLEAAESAGGAGGPARRADVGDWFYSRVWRRGALPAAAPVFGSCLVFLDDSELASRLTQRLELRGLRVTRVRPGAVFERTQGGYTIDPRSPADYGRLVTELGREGDLPEQVAHLWGLTAARTPVDGATSELLLERGFFSLFHLARALGEAGLPRPTRLVAFTEGVHEVTGGEDLLPERATILGPCRVIPHEFPNLACKNVDLDLAEWTAPDPAMLETLAGELGPEAREPVIAWRGGRRWVESFAPAPIAAPNDGPCPRLRRGGTYLVTGGFTGVGFVLARHLAESCSARLVLVGRTTLPERAQWEAILTDCADDDPVGRRLRNVLALEEAGAEVLPCAVDAADAAALGAAVAAAEAQLGPVRGIVHAAGVNAAGLMMVQAADGPRAGFAPKITATRNLAQLGAQRELDFLVLCSSLNSAKGVPGVVDYSAANNFLDAFARRYAADTGRFCVSISWTRWREVGMAADAAGGELAVEHGISNAEGAEVFRRALTSAPEPHLLVSEYDLWGLLKAASALSEDATVEIPADEVQPTAAPAGTGGGTGHPRPDLPTPYVEPETEMERALAQIWQEVLGLEQVGANDSFLELGGSSLLMVRVTGELEERSGVKVNLRALFHNTLAQIAILVEEAAAEQEPGKPEEPQEPKPGRVRGLLSRLGKAVRTSVDRDPDGVGTER